MGQGPDGRAEGHQGAAGEPVQLGEESQVRPPVQHQSSAWVQDQEGPEEEAEHDDGREDVADDGSGEDDDGAERLPPVGATGQQQDPGVGQ